MHRHFVRLLAPLAFAALVAGCGSDPSMGSAPVISNLTLDPVVVSRGAVTVRATLTVTDADLDANTIQVRLTAPDGTLTNSAPTAVSNLAGRTGVAVSVMVPLVLNAAGRYVVEFWVNDIAGHASNHLSGAVTAQ